MFKRLDPRDINITPFKVYKEFTVTNSDSGSGVYGFRAISSSIYNFDTTTSTKTTFDSASFYHIPSWFMINHMYYRDTQNNYNNFGQNNGRQYRLLHASASIISVSKDLYGERIKPGSITLSDDSGASTLTIKDDKNGNLYDNAFSSSFAQFASGGFADSDIVKSTGSFVGNVFYEQGVLVFTNTGSRFVNIGTGTGTDGYSLKYKAQVTIREHSYTCVIGENEYNGTLNISATKERSGSISVSGSESFKLFPPGHATAKSGSYKHFYQATNTYNNFVTHSEFRPYITKVGLYNDFNELIAIGQLSHPVKNDAELSLAINVRFDA
jgi:hypothetical protein|tara:strand:- start:479 stop:1453 length:975 start_codon:yes stop_codon:yes gene_type:complete